MKYERFTGVDFKKLAGDMVKRQEPTIETVGLDQLKITANCVVTGKPYSVTVRGSDFGSWKQGKLAQKAFPYLSADDREFLISGTSPEGWKQIFPQDEDEDDEQ